MVDASKSAIKGDPPVAAAPKALVDRRELALIAFERTRMPMVVTDPRQPDSPIVLANQAFLELTGYSADEVIGHNCRFLQGPQTSAADVHAIRGALSADRDASVEILNYRKDGTAFWNEVFVSPVTDKQGELLYFFGSQKDVTERRRTRELEAAERLLLIEVDHRALNAVQLVQSIIHLTCPSDAPGPAIVIRGRVDALARAHRLLARNRWSGAELREMLGLATERHKDRIDADGPSIPISPQMVQPIMLVLHEMLSNAVAHGALSRPDGAIIVRWLVEHDRTVLSWREQATAPPTVDPKPRLGLNLIEGIMTRQLGGSVSLAWPSDGLDATLVLPKTMKIAD